MKVKILAASLFLALTLSSCKKENTEKTTENSTPATEQVSETTTTVSETDSIQKNEYTYAAADGTEAYVLFTNGTKEGNFILIERNKLKIELPQTEAWAKGAVYEKDGIKAVSEGDKITITQDGKTYEINRKQ